MQSNISSNLSNKNAYKDDLLKVSNLHWQSAFNFGDFFLLLFLLITPTFILQISLFLMNDYILAHFLYLMSLIFLPYIYKTFRENIPLDVLYISEISLPSRQIKYGIIFGSIAAILLPVSVAVINKLGYSILSSSLLLIPFGVEVRSKFPKIMHAIYLFLYLLEFAIFTPLIENRFYLIFLRKKMSQSFFTFFIFLFLIFNFSYSIFVQFNEKNPIIVSIWFGGVFIMTLFVFYLLDSKGVITAIIFQMGVNLGICIVLGLGFYTNLMYDKTTMKAELFSDDNFWEMIFRGFIEKAKLIVIHNE